MTVQTITPAKLAERHLFGNLYANRRVLVTGDTGFKGSWLCLWLVLLGAKVIGYGLGPPTNPSLFDDLNLSSYIKHIHGDITNFADLLNTMRKHQPEIVFHLAAQPMVRASYLQPRQTLETNVMGTVNLLEAARCSESPKVLINVTSDKCYENMEREHFYRESDPAGGWNPYSVSKACSELATLCYRDSFFSHSSGLRVATVRSGNVIGGGDWAQGRIIPDCIRALNSGLPVKILHPEEIRPWMHVLEPISGYLWLASQLWQNPARFDCAWNFGPSIPGYLRVREVAEAVIQAWGSGSWQDGGTDQLPETSILKLDSTKVNHRLKWYPLLDIDTAIKNTVSWYKEYRRTDLAIPVTTKDIELYVAEGIRRRSAWAV